MTPPAPPMAAERLMVVMPGTLTCGPVLKICAPLTRPKGGLRDNHPFSQKGPAYDLSAAPQLRQDLKYEISRLQPGPHRPLLTKRPHTAQSAGLDPSHPRLPEEFIIADPE